VGETEIIHSVAIKIIAIYAINTRARGQKASKNHKNLFFL
jgi:hypothetical protein